MCAVSVISDYGSSITNWNDETLDQFKKLLDQAKVFDEKTKQPDCEDPTKLHYLEIVEKKLAGE